MAARVERSTIRPAMLAACRGPQQAKQITGLTSLKRAFFCDFARNRIHAIRVQAEKRPVEADASLMTIRERLHPYVQWTPVTIENVTRPEVLKFQVPLLGEHKAAMDLARVLRSRAAPKIGKSAM